MEKINIFSVFLSPSGYLIFPREMEVKTGLYIILVLLFRTFYILIVYLSSNYPHDDI